MDTVMLENCPSTEQLVGLAQKSLEPIIVLDESSECMVVMAPSVLERILFDTAILNLEDRASLHV